MKIKLTKSHGNTWGKPDTKDILIGTLEITKYKDEDVIDLLNECTKGSYWWEKVDV